MTTDITELVQRARINAECGEHLSPAETMELVEALEKAQKRISELEGGKIGSALLERENHHGEVVGKLTEHITELESEVEKWKQEAEVWEKVAEKQLATAIKLESRTVKLPEPEQWDITQVLLCKKKVVAAIRAAGIKVEAE